jgi:sugar lactone lactonase YvrE
MLVMNSGSPAALYEPRLVSDAALVVGEGPLWADGDEPALLWVDHEGQIRRYDPASGRDEQVYGRRGLVASVRRRARGGFVVAFETQIVAIDGERVDDVPLAVVERREQRLFNDTAVDPAGRLWVGLHDPQFGAGTGELLRVDTDGSVHDVVAGLLLPNGIGFSPAGDELYLVDSFTYEVLAYAFDSDRGTLGERRTVWDAQDGGYPDGLAVDTDGNLWIAFWEGAAVRCISPRGVLLREVAFPVAQTSSCAFGGAGLGDLYVTSARYELTDEAVASQPHAGGLFHVATDVVGAPTFAFAG